jgi:hypothetical protein
MSFIWGTVDWSAPDDACIACHKIFEPEDEVSECHECPRVVHVRCFMLHLGCCDRRRN